jgi:hypothetical protein
MAAECGRNTQKIVSYRDISAALHDADPVSNVVKTTLKISLQGTTD